MNQISAMVCSGCKAIRRGRDPGATAGSWLRNRLMVHWLAVGLIVLSGLPSPVFAASKYVLLIGISDYRGSSLPSLDGPLNDIASVQQVLVSRFEVPKTNIKVLLNKQATHTKIRAAFATLAATVHADDWVYIHYSGHGSTASDPNDPRGEDQTWVPFGARSGRTGENDWDILDKEINFWLYPIYQKTTNIVFISDSCHSATVSRGSMKGVRSVKSDLRPHPLLGKVPEVAIPETGIRIGAARDFESAVELDTADGGSCAGSKKCAGVFTYYWMQQLQKAQPTDSWRDIFDRTSALVSTQRGVAQRPQLEGRSDALVFSGGFSTQVPSIYVTELDNQRRAATLDAGTLSGITVGSTFYPVASRRSKTDNAILRITDVGIFDSKASIVGGVFSKGELVREASHKYVSRPVKLYVGADFDKDLDRSNVAKLRTALSALQGFQLVNDRAGADWLVYVVRPELQSADVSSETQLGLPPPSSKPNSIQPLLVVVSPQGLLMNDRMRIPMTGDDSILTLADNLKKFVWAREIRKLGQGGAGISVDVQVKTYKAAASCVQPCNNWDLKSTSNLVGLRGLARFGNKLQFELHNRDAMKSVYAYLIAVGPSSEVQVLFPRRDQNQDDARLEPQQIVNVPTTYTLDEEGTESIIALSTDSPIEAQMLSQAGYAAIKGDQSLSPVEMLLHSVATGRGSVGVTVDAWSGLSAEMEIRRAN